jgi:tetratricopeptide (TPR) repeat protein
MRRTLLLCLLVAAMVAMEPRGQGQSAADEAFKAQDWAKAAAEYQKLTAANPQDGHAWYQLAMSLYSQDKFADAAPAFQRSAELKYLPVISTYNTAASLARAGKNDTALDWLEKLPPMGYSAAAQLKQDPDFATLKNAARFQAVVAAVQKNATPCDTAEVNRQFDFWLGEWEVQTPQGQHAGNSSIQRILGGCVVLENWSGLGGLDGKSFNIYNPAMKKWQQYWVDSSGRATLYIGEAAGGEMRYLAEAGLQNGKVDRKMTFTRLSPDKVRQLGEMSTDGGKTWAVAYDLIYVRKK